jgi:phosphate starvation-inducible protein PhoH and related proteins
MAFSAVAAAAVAPSCALSPLSSLAATSSALWQHRHRQLAPALALPLPLDIIGRGRSSGRRVALLVRAASGGGGSGGGGGSSGQRALLRRVAPAAGAAIEYTARQRAFLALVDERPIVVLHGPAGTGKTRCAVDAGVAMLAGRRVQRLVITRPAVCAQEEHGFLPGSMEDKMRPWMMPIYDALGAHFRRRDVEDMLREGVVEICPLAYMRGRTFDAAFVVCDEAQNCTPTQLKMVLTRIGRDSRLVVTGDPDQDDLAHQAALALKHRGRNGLADLLDRLDRNGAPPEGVGQLQLGAEDVVRHAAIPGILSLYRDA